MSPALTLTPQPTLSGWLLRVLDDANGRATKWQALDAIEKRYGQLLTEHDRLPEPKVSEQKWQNRTCWERNALVEAGFLQPTAVSGRGVWALTALGREAARKAG